MKRLGLLAAIVAAIFMMSGAIIADDGAITNKSMSKTIKVPIFDQEAVNEAIPEAEHAFIDMMGFYVPAQAANGEVGPIAYCDVDNKPESGEDCTLPVETLDVARPLVSVFLYGPAFGVDGTAFAHRWFDTYGAISLDDGETWKKTNLSESADLSSFDLELDQKHKDHDPLPNDHTELLGNKKHGALHQPGYELPYTYHCSECHGVALQGTTQAPSCYSCHEKTKFDEPTPVELGPIVISAVFDKKKLLGQGVNGPAKSKVTLINGETGEQVATARTAKKGEFTFNVKLDTPPCTIAAQYDNSPLDPMQGPAIRVVDKSGEPVEDCEGHPIDVTQYPGGSYNVFHATAGNKTLVAWPSRYCQKGQPAYSLTTDGESESGLTAEEKEARLSAIVSLIQTGDTDLNIDALPGFSMSNDLYLVDAFGVAGRQGSIDFADEGYPQAGVVPFGCVWTARGVLLPGDDPRTEDTTESSHMVWTKAERLTSGRRDPNRIEVHAVEGAGFVITWQEDPEGLRPGQGLGPGQGWSGAVAHPQTDAWYSFINWEYFDIVEDSDDTTIPTDIIDHDLLDSGRPQVFVPMAVPMRLSNNGKCNPPEKVTQGDGSLLYCNYNATEDIPIGARSYGLRDQCADTIIIDTGNEDGPGITPKPICVADSFDGIAGPDLPNRANTALTRPRTSLQVYTKPSGDKSAWVVVAAEKSKGLGKYFFYPDGLKYSQDSEDPDALPADGYADLCVEDKEDPECAEEIGKNQWYYSFDMGTPDTSADWRNPNSLVRNLVSQGNMLNQAEVYWETGELYGLMDTADMQGYSGTRTNDLNELESYDYDFDIVNTEIARRASILVQPIGKAMASANKLVAISSWKQGAMRQGGPADTMFRRFVIPRGFDPAVDNPYAFENMECRSFQIPPNTNPYYPGGVCADPAINLSGVVPDVCKDDGTGDPVECPKVDFSLGSTFGIGDTNPILQGYIKNEGNQTRVLAWHQCPSGGVPLVGTGLTLDNIVTCDSDERTDPFVNLRDQSWYNPLDVSKGHRGFIDGDFVMFLYAWSPNWRLNAKGNDRYELYVRRSFDGGKSWRTTPREFTASDGVTYDVGDGTVTCESYRKTETGTGDAAEPRVCFGFRPGAYEHARNITQHKSMKITTLDPRYAKAKGSIIEGCADGLFRDPADNIFVNPDGAELPILTCDDGSTFQDADQRDPSRYFMVFETGDNTTVAVGEAEPLDLHYGRAESFGDDYVVWTETDTVDPNAPAPGEEGYDPNDPNDPSLCYPSDPHGVLWVEDTVMKGSGFCNEFDRMNTAGDTHSSEANLEADPYASKMYGVWGQWVFDDSEEEIEESDAQARRIWWIDDWVSTENAYTLPGTKETNP